MSIDIPFGGLFARNDPTRITMDRAITASDCYLDDNVVKGRNGYRACVSSGGVATQIGSGTIQGMARFRPSASSARTVVVRGGHIYLVTDPSTSTASDGAVTDLGLLLPTTANVSLAQLGSYMYCAPDDGSQWVRITPSYGTEGVAPLAKPSGTGTTSTPTMQVFSSVAASVTASSGSLDTNYQGLTGWYHLNTTAGATITVTLTTAVDLSACAWLLVVACSMSRNSNGVFPLQVEIGNSSGSYVVIGTESSNYRADAPSSIYCSLAGVSSNITSDVKYFRFKSTNTNYSEVTCYGYYGIPVNPGNSTQTYYLTYYNSTYSQESPLSDAINITLTPFVALTYPNLQAHYQSYYNAGGTASSDPHAPYVYNNRADSTSPSPTSSELVPNAVVNGTSAQAYGTGTGQADQIRLYRATESGVRLVKYITNPGTGVAFTITDNQGTKALGNYSYIAQGTPVACEAIGASGGRLACGGASATPQRMNISTFVGFTQTTDPFVQFPAVPSLQSDGWAFDVAPTSAEQVLWLGNGDQTLYCLSNEATYYMSDLSAPIYNPASNTPVKIWQRGAIGRNSALWAEDRLFWCATDGIYTALNRAMVDEMTGEIRNYYLNTFAPDTTTVMGYQDRCLFAFCGTKFIRYSFVNQCWTTGTLAHSVARCVFWRDPTSTNIQMWLLDTSGRLWRWQSTCTSDGMVSTTAGTAIPDWVYSTGFSVTERNTRPRFLFVDTSATVTVYLYTTSTSSPERDRSFSVVGESELAFPPDLKGRKWRISMTASNTTQVNRVMYEAETVEARGG